MNISWQDSVTIILEGNYCDKMWQIGAIDIECDYGFITHKDVKDLKKRTYN